MARATADWASRNDTRSSVVGTELAQGCRLLAIAGFRAGFAAARVVQALAAEAREADKTHGERVDDRMRLAGAP